MFDSLLAKVSLAIVSAATVVAGLFGVHPAPSQQKPIGAAIPVVVSLFETSLQASISTSATSMTLVSGTDRAGNPLSGYICFTIDEGTSSAEFTCGSASSTSVTGLIRGISPLTGTSTVASLQFSHRRGASVKVTNYPQLAIVSRVLNGNETLPNALVYDSGVSSSSLASNLQNVASVAYVNGVAVAGAPNASAAVKGIVQAATGAQISIGTGTGSTGALLFAPATLFSSTSSATILVPVTKANGKLAQGFLDLSENFTFTGALTNTSATTTLVATTTKPLILDGIPYSFPFVQGTASSTLSNNASGTLSWVPLFSFNNLTTVIGGTMSSQSLLVTATATLGSLQHIVVNSIGLVTEASQPTGSECRVELTIDDAATTTVATAIFSWTGGGTATNRSSANFTYISPTSYSAGQHLVKLYGTSVTNTCSYSGMQFSIFNGGN